MTATVRGLLQRFDSLPEPDRRELAAEILRRSLYAECDPLSDDDLVRSAEELFRELDREESARAEPTAR
ncbi:MAG: hypothetical protein FJ290_30215 [Planctomycetes bacterium]|nr:hypothetical protein [Planctomycetota bacterium]